jgi:hypothetical protein
LGDAALRGIAEVSGGPVMTTPPLRWDQDAFRAGLEIGILATDVVWQNAVMSQRHLTLAVMKAEVDVASMLITLKPREPTPSATVEGAT